MDESWLVIAAAITWVYVTSRIASPPGPSFTSAWLFIGFQGYLLDSPDVLNCFYLCGAGVIAGWYGCQLLDSTAWPRIMNIWIPQFPWAPRAALSASVRAADLYIHALPFYIACYWSLHFGTGFGLKSLIQIMILERSYWLFVDRSLLGDGNGVNRVYRIVPCAPPRFFWTLQALSIGGQLTCLVHEKLVRGYVDQQDSTLHDQVDPTVVAHGPPQAAASVMRASMLNRSFGYTFVVLIAVAIIKAHVQEISTHANVKPIKDFTKSALEQFSSLLTKSTASGSFLTSRPRLINLLYQALLPQQALVR